MIPKMRKIRGEIDYPEILEKSQICKGAAGVYELIAVSVHLGSIHSGHYMAFCKKEDGQWYGMDDNKVVRVSSSEVFHHDAYMLFYQACS